MKKIVFSMAAMACFALSAMAQIPNAGFENWTSMGSYSNPDAWGTMNNTTTLGSVYTATMGTPGNPGNSYLKLISKTVGPVVVNGIAVSGKLDSTTMTPKSGFAYTGRPTSLTGQWQHMIYGSSQGSIVVTLTRWDAGMNMQMPVASGSVTLSGMAMSWANFTIPLTYVDAANPDTCIIVMKASGSAPANNDYLFVDNLAFTTVATGINEQAQSISQMAVYPNPVSGVAHIRLNLAAAVNVRLELHDLQGRLVRSKDLGTLEGTSEHSLDVNGLAKGTYLLETIGGTSKEVRKIVIE